MLEYSKYVIGNKKVAIIGAGFVGSSIAYALALRDIAREIVLIDVNKEKAEGEARDIRHGIPSMGTADLYAGDYSDCSNCDLIIITAGRNRKAGETRLDMTNENVEIVRNVINSLKEYYNKGVIMIITNPVDIITQKVSEWMDLPNGMVLGTGCILDTSRFIRLIADYLKISTGVISGYLIGEHGDGQIPLWSKVSVGAIPIEEFCNGVDIPWNNQIRKDITEKTRIMGADIIRTKGKTHYGIATCVSHLSDAILSQKPTIASVCSPLMGEHGVRGVSLSVPSVIGPAGVQQRIREKWEPDEYRGFFDSVENVRKILQDLC